MKALAILLLSASLALGQNDVGVANLGNAAIGGGEVNTNVPAPPGTNCTLFLYGTGDAYTNSAFGSLDGGGNDCVGVMFATTNTTPICKAAVWVAPDNVYNYVMTLGVYTGDTSGWTDTPVGTISTNTVGTNQWTQVVVEPNTGTLVSGTNYWLVLKLTPAVGTVHLGAGAFPGTAPTRIRCATKLNFGGDPGNGYGLGFNCWGTQ